jgi:hypothetical protein
MNDFNEIDVTGMYERDIFGEDIHSRYTLYLTD